MALSELATNGNIIELDEEIEGNQIGTKNYRFSKIGEPVPIKPADVEFEFDSHSPPSQPLAVSKIFRLLFVAHSDGFCVARTTAVLESAEEIKEKGSGPSIQELSVVDVPIGKVSILALSADDSTIAVSSGGDLHFFSVSALLHKEQKPSFSCSLNDSSCIKDMRWTRKLEKCYVVLSINGKLYHGAGQGPLKDVMDDVDAVEWSVRGNFVAVARKNVLNILSSKFKEKLSFLLSCKFIDYSDANYTVKVDSIRWVRPDCIIIGCFQLTENGKEENYIVQVITSKDGKITDASSKPIVLSFKDVFLGFMGDVVSFGSGPHMFLSYLDQRELVFVANRKNMDQHIVLFGWSLVDDNNEVVMVDILNDAWLPRIDPRGDGDDNLILGLSIDEASHGEKVKLMLGEEEREVSPCCVLLCLTVDGKLTMFHFASAAGVSVPPEQFATVSDEEDDTSLVIPSEKGQSKISSIGKPSVEKEWDSQEVKKKELITNVLDEVATKNYQRPTAVEQSLTAIRMHEESTTGNQELKPVVSSHTFKHDEQVPIVKPNQDGDGQQSLFCRQLVSTLEDSSVKTSHLEGPRSVIRDFSETVTQKLAEPRSSTNSFSVQLLTDTSCQSIGKDSHKGFGMELPGKFGSTSLQSASSQSRLSGKLISSATSDGRSSLSPSSGVQSNQSDNFNRNMSTSHFSGGPLQDPSYSKETAGPSISVSPVGHTASTGAGNIRLLPAARTSQFPLQENFAWGKSSKVTFHPNKKDHSSPSPSGLLISEPNLSKQFRNVEEMAKELDTLLECIEGADGFKDAAIALQESSVVALEKDLCALSDRCKMRRGIMDQWLGEIQLLLDRTVQVLARKIYMEGIVRQATDTQYWDLWNRQKLSSELELKRKYILEVNQDLTNQLIELERHFNTLELNKFGENGGVRMNRRAFQSLHGTSRHVQSLHSLHNTMSAQLAAAEKLSECLSKQMDMLSVVSPLKKQTVKKELFEMIGIPYNVDSFSSPDGKKAGDTLSNKKDLISSCSAAAKEQFSRNQSSTMKSSEPESARRRRDSLDRTWTSFEPPKTTVKRVLLQDSRKVSTNRSSLLIEKQHNSHWLDGSAVAHPKYSATASTSLYPSKSRGIQHPPTKESSENPSNSLFRWANDLPDLAQAIGPISPAMQVLPTNNLSAFLSHTSSQSTPIVNQIGSRETYNYTAERSSRATCIAKSDSFAVDESRSSQQYEAYQTSSISRKLPAQALTFPRNSSEISNFKDKGIRRDKSTIGNVKHVATITDNSLYESGESREFLFSPVSAVDSAPSLSGKVLDSETATGNGQPGEIISSCTSPSISSSSSTKLIHSSSAPPSSFLKPVAPTLSSAMSLGRLTTSSKASVGANQTASHSQKQAFSSSVLPPTSSFHDPEKLIPSSTIPPVDVSSKSPKTEFQPPMAEFNSKADEKSTAQASVTKFRLKTDENSTKQASPLQPELPDGTSSLKCEPTLPSTNEPPSSSKSGSQLSLRDMMNPASNVALNPKTEQPFGANFFSSPTLSSSGAAIAEKNESSGVAVTQEDEMEEEAPETSLTTEFTLGNLGGLGIGSAPNATTAKPNPFSVAFVNSAANPTSSPFSMAVPSGELFQPASFNFQSLQPSLPLQPTNFGGFSTGTTSQIPNASGFGQSSQIGSGQQALGSVLGAFGQSRQLGAGLPGTVASTSAFSGGGFVGNHSTGGFLNPATGGGFAGVASTGGGFASLASAGGGFSSLASAGGGFAAAATATGGFGGAASGNGFSVPGGGFGAFGNQQGSVGFSAFGSSAGTGRPPSPLFTQIRK